MNTRQVNSAAGVILAALQQQRTAAGIALALESAGLLMSPEAAADMASVSTDAVGVAEQAVKELQREHELSAELRRALDQSQEDVTGACLARWEEEQDNARLRLALASAKRGRARLRGQVSELLVERHSTNEALDDAVQALRADRAEPAKGPSAAESADKLTRLFAPTQALREEPAAEAVTHRVQAMRALLDGQRAAVEDPHDGPLHHSYRVPRDLPEMGGR